MLSYGSMCDEFKIFFRRYVLFFDRCCIRAFYRQRQHWPALQPLSLRSVPSAHCSLAAEVLASAAAAYKKRDCLMMC